MSSYEAVVIGSGVNGLVAAAELALAGWRVAVIERREGLGGFIASGERTLPGFVHDTFSSWHPLFVSGGGYESLGDALHERGLRYANTDGPMTGSISHRGSAIAYRDALQTAEGFAEPEDSRAYLAMLEEMGSRAEVVFGALGSDLRSPATVSKLGFSAWRSQKLSGVEALLRDAVASGRSFSRGRFAGSEADQIWAPWLLHAGMSPDHASGGMMIPVLAATMHGFGLPTVAGGADNFVRAFARLFLDLGVTVLAGHHAERLVVRSGRVTGVVTDKGLIERHPAGAVRPVARGCSRSRADQQGRQTVSVRACRDADPCRARPAIGVVGRPFPGRSAGPSQ